MTRLLTILCLCASVVSALGQVPPTVQPITWYASAFGYDGVSLSNQGSPEVSWQGQATLERWPYNYTNRWCVLIGKRSHSYYALVDAGTNSTVIFPPTVPPAVFNFYYAGQFVTASTSGPAAAVLKAFPGQSNFVNIGVSTDGVAFEPLKILSGCGTGAAWQITKTSF